MNTELFEKNLEIVEKYQPDLGAYLKGLENTASSLVDDDGVHNIDLGHVNFYDGGAEDFTDKQFSKFLDDPRRVQLGWPTPLSENVWKAQKFRTSLREYYEEKGITSAPEQLDSSAGFAVILGLGLGFHIDKIFAEYDIRSIYIAEQYPEFIYHAMHVHNVGDWYEEAERRNGQFLINIGNDANQLTNMIFTQVKYQEFGLADGAYFYEHYDSYLMKQVREFFYERMPVFAANPGFFEDEIAMMTNCFQNITTNKFWDFTDSNRMIKDTPVFIAGSGPSLDNSIDIILENRDKIVLVTAGTGLGTILAYGIKPDFHVEMENTPGPPRFIGELAEKYDLSGIVLVAPNTVHPKVPPFFDRSILFFRDAVTSTKFFGANSQEIYHAAPVVTNAATRIALGLGFKEIYLIGVDLGARIQDEHHSKKSIYYGEGFMDANPAHKEASTFTVKAPGNLGGEVYTNVSFLNASMYFTIFQTTFPLATLYNLSDGVKILGAIPKLAETVDSFPESSAKDRELRQIIDTHDRFADYMKVNVDDLQALHDRAVVFYDDLRVAAESMNTDEPNIFAFYDAIKPIVYMDQSTPVDQTMHQFNVGTVMMFYQTAFQMLRRMKQEDRPEFMTLFKATFLQYVGDMEVECLAFLKDMTKKT